MALDRLVYRLDVFTLIGAGQHRSRETLCDVLRPSRRVGRGHIPQMLAGMRCRLNRIQVDDLRAAHRAEEVVLIAVDFDLVGHGVSLLVCWLLGGDGSA